MEAVKTGDLTIAFAKDIARYKLSDLISKLIGQDIFSFPFFRALTISEMGLGLSNNSISSTLLVQESLSDTNLLQYYDNSIPSGFSGFLRFDFHFLRCFTTKVCSHLL